MNVAVVGQDLEGRATGVGRVLQGFLSGLPRAAPEDWRIRIHLRGSDPSPASVPATLADDGRFSIRADGSGIRPVLWEQTRLARTLRRERPDLVYSPGYSLPLSSGRPGVLTLHDLSFEHRGDDLRFRERWRRRLLARWSCWRARRVLADTDRGAEEIASTYGIARDRIGVVPLGVDARFRPGRTDADARVLGGLGIATPYLLHLGSIFPRRHLPEILEALREVFERHDDLTLVLAGADHLPEAGGVERLVAASGLGDRVRRLGWVDDDAVPALYRGARACLYLSGYEGYGLPPLESLSCGTPALVAAAPALEERWPDYPFRIAPERLSDPDAIGAALTRLLDDPERCAEVGERGAALGRSESWVAAAGELCRQLGEAAS